MIQSLLIALVLSIPLVIATVLGSFYYQRERLEFLPKIWSLTWFSSAFFACAIMKESALLTYFVILAAAFLGLVIGYIVLEYVDTHLER